LCEQQIKKRARRVKTKVEQASGNRDGDCTVRDHNPAEAIFVQKPATDWPDDAFIGGKAALR
jgi:hypothetical protein